jgi:glyoxylase-like metal-dependent hydrolase (beta-lactamase superfamily II)
MESTTYLVIDENGKEHGIITGDTLFIGDVGRPDLAQHVIADLTEDKLAGHLFDSLRNKIMPLSDDLIVYPNHGAGSACGKMMSKETTDTLGNQKRTNYALDPKLTKEEFKKELLTGLTAASGLFPEERADEHPGLREPRHHDGARQAWGTRRSSRWWPTRSVPWCWTRAGRCFRPGLHPQQREHRPGQQLRHVGGGDDPDIKQDHPPRHRTLARRRRASSD